jgi:UDP:flavonoid glycosyltransferase YjiC (YdhE family)
MRVLFTVQPMFGHFHAMVPLAQALQEHGHEVAFATGKSFGPVVQHAGFRHFPCGFDFDGSGEILQELPEWEAITRRVPPGPIQHLYGFIEGLGPRMADDLLELVTVWQPEVIVRDPLEFGGYIAAEYSGVPHATIMWAFYITPKPVEGGKAILELRQRYELPADPSLDSLDRYLVLDFLPAAWTFPHWPPPPVTHRFCAPPFDRSSDAGLPEWFHSLPPQPTVYATLGTTFNQAPATFQAVADAFSGEKLNLIMTLGRANDPAQFQPDAPNIKIARYIPQTLLLPHCAAIIFHGGYNSLLSALWHGLPMVIIPQGGGDQLITAHRCAEVGLGIMVEETPPTAEAVRSAVKTVLEQPDYRLRAQQFQQEIKALPPLSEAVKRLEILAQSRAPQISSDT